MVHGVQYCVTYKGTTNNYLSIFDAHRSLVHKLDLHWEIKGR